MHLLSKPSHPCLITARSIYSLKVKTRAIQKKPIHLHKLKTPYRWTHNAAETYIKVLKSNEIVNSIKLFNNSTYDNNFVAYQGPNQTNQDSIEAWLKHEEANSTRQQQEDINQTPSPSEYSLQQDKESG